MASVGILCISRGALPNTQHAAEQRLGEVTVPSRPLRVAGTRMPTSIDSRPTVQLPKDPEKNTGPTHGLGRLLSRPLTQITDSRTPIATLSTHAEM